MAHGPAKPKQPIAGPYRVAPLDDRRTARAQCTHCGRGIIPPHAAPASVELICAAIATGGIPLDSIDDLHNLLDALIAVRDPGVRVLCFFCWFIHA